MNLSELECPLWLSITNKHGDSEYSVLGLSVGDLRGSLSDRFDSNPHWGCVCDSVDGLDGLVWCYDQL